MCKDDLTGKTVLVIDDHPVVREAVQDLFGLAGCRVFTAPDGETGVRLADAQLPDAIVSDCSIRGADALEVLRRVRENPRTAKIPVVVMTFDPAADLRERCLRGGASAFVPKHDGPGHLLDVVSEALAEAGRAAA